MNDHRRSRVTEAGTELGLYGPFSGEPLVCAVASLADRPCAASSDHQIGLHIARVPGPSASRRAGGSLEKVREPALCGLCRGQTCLEQEIEHAQQTLVLTLLRELDL